MKRNEYDYYILGMEAALTSLQSSLEGYEHALDNRCWDRDDYKDWSSCVECLKTSIEGI